MAGREARILAFLNSVWSNQPGNEGHVFLSWMADWSKDEWHDRSFDRAGGIEIPTIQDLYFAPSVFSSKRRRKENALSSAWLWADLDEVDPRKLGSGVRATLSWETSPGRFQALWRLERPQVGTAFEHLNRRLTYYVGADKGGWAANKVLRVPGSVSMKRGEPFEVRLVEKTRRVYKISDLLEVLGSVRLPEHGRGGEPFTEPEEGSEAVWQRHRGALIGAPWLERLIRAEEGDGDRSGTLWRVEHGLLDLGIPPRDIYLLLKDSVWNKFSDRRDGRMALWRDIQKAASQKDVVSDERTDDNSELLLNTLSHEQFMARQFDPPQWLVDEIWVDKRHGIVAGEYKAYKTVLLLDLAVSVASGEPFLGRYKVRRPGTVCYVHEEGHPGSVRNHMWRIEHQKGLTDRVGKDKYEIVFDGRHNLPIWITSLPRLNLQDPESRAQLERHVAAMQPVLVILETFYLLAGGVKENNEDEVKPILAFLAKLSYDHGCSVVLSHHFHKNRDDEKRFIDRISGSGIFGRWYESGMFIERKGVETDNSITVYTSHRDGQSGKFSLRIQWETEKNGEEEDGTTLEIAHLDEGEEEEKRQLVRIMGMMGSQGFVTKNEVAAQLGLDESTVRSRARKWEEIEYGYEIVDGRRQAVLRRLPGMP
jgi:AAA domain/RepB DNA-primase from phage plasmid